MKRSVVRRLWAVAIAAALGAALPCVTTAVAQDREDPLPPRQPPPKLTGRVRPEDFGPRTRQAIRNGLRWLAAAQNQDGSWSCKIGYKLNENYYGKDGPHVGVTALAGMAYMAAGNLPDRGEHAASLSRALDFVVRSSRPEDGYITSNGTRMYEHAFATLFLSHVYGMTQRPEVRDCLKRATALLEQSQNAEGGWRYQPQPVDADISVTVSVLQALRAAYSTGIEVRGGVIERAMKYIRQCATPWGFQYQSNRTHPFNDTRRSYALTAAGIVSMYSAGIYDAPEIRNALQRLRDNFAEMAWGKYHFFYGHYYACQAMYIAGGELWREYFHRLWPEILEHQDPDGGWTDDVGRTYATAMACLVLQIPAEQFPIFQK